MNVVDEDENNKWGAIYEEIDKNFFDRVNCLLISSLDCVKNISVRNNIPKYIKKASLEAVLYSQVVITRRKAWVEGGQKRWINK